MTNNQPFDILLDMYPEESYALYTVVRTLFSYPPIENVILDEEDTEGKLYASAFAMLCADYMHAAASMYKHDDFELFLEQMQFTASDCKPILKRLQLKPEVPVRSPGYLEEAMWLILKHYRKQIARDIQTVFTSQELVSRLFASIHADGSCHQDFFAVLSFVQDNFPGLGSSLRSINDA